MAILKIPSYIGDSANAKNAGGLTINQAANDDEIVSLKSSDVAHTVTTETEADTYGLLKKNSATLGGLLIRGLTDATGTGLTVEGIIGATDPTDSDPAIVIIGSKQTGNTVAALGTDETVLAIKNRTTDLLTIKGGGVIAAATATDNTATTQLATTAYAKSQDAVLAREPNQGIAMTAAASGSNGIQVADNDNIDMGTNNFALVWKGSLPDWTPENSVELFWKNNTSTTYTFYIHTDGSLRAQIAGSVGDRAVASSLTNSFTNATVHELVMVFTVGAVNTTADIYADGVAFGTQQSFVNAGSLSNAIALQILGTSAKRNASTTHHAYILNFAPTAAEVLDMYRNGPKLAWFDPTGVSPASQTAQTSGSLVANKEYTIDTFVAGDDFSNVATVISGTINTTGCRFLATGTTPTTWTNSSSLRRTGVTWGMMPEGMQPAPGQCFDFSGNKLHAMQPATGSSLTRYKKTGEIRWTNTWAGTHEAQYIGGINQAILPANCYIESIVGVVSGATIEDIIVGDGSDTDHWVEITTGLAAGTYSFAIANRISDGTNYKMVADPDANFTGSIKWTIKYSILEA